MYKRLHDIICAKRGPTSYYILLLAILEICKTKFAREQRRVLHENLHCVAFFVKFQIVGFI